MNQHDPILEALDRLATVADTDPVGDRMPAIRRRVQVTRRRNTALAVSGVAAVVALGIGLDSLIQGPERGIDPAPSPTGTPSSPTSPTESEPSGTETVTLPPTQVQERVRADLDGDGTADQVELWVPEGSVQGDPTAGAWLATTVAGVEAVVPVGDLDSYYSLGQPTDLDGNGTDELFVDESQGGDGASTAVYVWTGDSLVMAEPDPAAPKAIAADGRLTSSAEFSGFSLQDGGLWSWRLREYAGGPEATTWKWELDGTTLTAVKQPGTQCVNGGVIAPC